MSGLGGHLQALFAPAGEPDEYDRAYAAEQAARAALRDEREALEIQLAAAKAARDNDTCRALLPRLNTLRREVPGPTTAQLARMTPDQKLMLAIFGPN